jgi:hypothetical protein
LKISRFAVLSVLFQACSYQPAQLPAAPPGAADGALAAKSSCATSECIYVSVTEGQCCHLKGRINGYPVDGNGDIKPSFSIAGVNTTMTNPAGVFVDSRGNFYVTNPVALGNVLIYSKGSRGNQTPSGELHGKRTRLNTPLGISTDQAGFIYVANLTGLHPISHGSISVYAPGSKSDAPPVRLISGTKTGLNGPDAVCVCRGFIYVVNSGSLGAGSISEFSKRANGNVAPLTTIAGGNTGLTGPGSVAVSESGEIYVANSNDSITVYSAGASGDATPIQTITGPNTGLSRPIGVGVDSAGDIYVANSTASNITVYAPGANGDAAPIRTISGPRTGMTGHVGDLAIH